MLILHGLFQSSGSFVTSEDRSLAFWLARHGGYQVYLGNTRGIFDMGHRNFSRNDPRFWGECRWGTCILDTDMQTGLYENLLCTISPLSLNTSAKKQGTTRLGSLDTRKATDWPSSRCPSECALPWEKSFPYSLLSHLRSMPAHLLLDSRSPRSTGWNGVHGSGSLGSWTLFHL